MKIKGIYILIVIMSIITVSSCYYDKADLLYPPTDSNCDTTSAISYSQKVAPLLQQYCYSCHSGGSPSGGIAMGTYATDKAIAINGKLYGSISYNSGYLPMPQGAAKLSDCQITTIKRWIDANTPDN
jgi:mono/diheme cytochrome c family protein